VTESGINNAVPEPLPPIAQGVSPDGPSTPLGLMWIGAPLGTYAGLLILLGSDDRGTRRSDPRRWPLPFSRALGVRIYESRV